MKAKLVLVMSVLFSPLALAGNSVQITEVGLKGYFSATLPTPVSVSVDVPPDVESITLDFRVLIGEEEEKYGPWQVDRFSKQLLVRGGEQAKAIVPLQLPAALRSKLELSVRARDGRYLGGSTVGLTSLTKVFSDTLVAIVCRDRWACDEAQSQVSYSGSEEEVLEKDRNYKFVAIESPRQNWLDYAVANYVVVASPLSSWTLEERSALETYTRQGGTLVLVEKIADDDSFLAPYRQGEVNERNVVGRGSLYHVSSLASKELVTLFSGKTLKQLGQRNNRFDAHPADIFRRMVAASFDFPRLRWLLLWLGAYVMVAGAGNFALLLRFGRLEWGWVTTAAISVLFAIGLYFSSSSHRPKQVTLDDLAVFWMDARSPQAVEMLGLRVSSPERQTLGISVGEDAVLTSGGASSAGAADVDVATEITREHRLRPGLDVRLGPPLEVEISLLRWSFADLGFQTFHTFPGTVTLSKDLHLRNDTGQRFRESMYFNFPENKKYFISGLDPGQEIDLNSISPTAIRVEVRRETEDFQIVANELVVDPATARKGSFPIALLPDKLPLTDLGQAFVGVCDGPERDVTIPDVKFARTHLSLVVVALDQP